MLRGIGEIRRCIDRLGPERLLCGSNYYSMARLAAVEERELLSDARLPPEQTTPIAGGNARRVFALK